MLKRLVYSENKGKDFEWNLEEVLFNKQNLITGKNSTGKTRLCNVLNSISKITYELIDSNFSVDFTDSKENLYRYSLESQKGKIINEKFEKIGDNDSEDNFIYFSRRDKEKLVYNEMKEDYEKFSPPDNILSIHSRRDEKEFGYMTILETFLCQFEILNGLQITDKNFNFKFRKEGSDFKCSFDYAVQYISYLFKDSEEQKKKILKYMRSCGFKISDFHTNERKSISGTYYELFLKETGMKEYFNIEQISSGMYFTWSMIVFLEYIIQENKKKIIVIDDFGENLDYETSAKLIKHLFKRAEKHNIQLIFTTNNRHLINAAELKDIIILVRKEHNVKSYSYIKNEKLFEKFDFIGLSNYSFYEEKFFDKVYEEKNF